MTSETIWSELFSKKPQIIKPGLDRMRRALAHLESQDRLKNYPPIVLVGGTNGKGSTSGFLFQLLARSGLRVGFFSSPHLCDFAERIQCSHLNLDDKQLFRGYEHLKSHLGTALFEELSFFELNTLLARQVFLEASCDLWILEVGMGGRWDATNVFDPILSVITSVGLDHMEFLGPTTSAIAREKSGIMRRQRPVIWGGLQESDPFAHEEVLMQARERGALLISGGRDFKINVKSPEGSGTLADPQPITEELWCQGGRRRFPLPSGMGDFPPFLKLNFLKAFAVYLELYDRKIAPAEPEIVLGGYSEIKTPPTLWGRFQKFDLTALAPETGLGQVIFDVGHNPHGVRALSEALEQIIFRSPKKIAIDGLISILGDKDVDEMLDLLRTKIPSLILFASQSERAFQQKKLASRHQDLLFAKDFRTACALRKKTLQDHQESYPRVTVIAGSVYALGEVMKELGLSPLAGGRP